MLARRRRGDRILAKRLYLPPFLGLRHDGVHYQVRISLPVPRMLQLDLHILPKPFRRQPLYQSLRDFFGMSGMIFSVRAAINCLEVGVVAKPFSRSDRIGSTLSNRFFPLYQWRLLSLRPRTRQITPPLRPHHAHFGSQSQLQAASEKWCAIHRTREQNLSARDSE